MKITKQYLKQVIKEELEKTNEAMGITQAFTNSFDPTYANLQRAALLAMQGRLGEATGNLSSALKGVDDKVRQEITDALKNIKPVTINGKVASSSDLDKSKPHNEWIQNTFIPWAMNKMGKK
jgi:hypothetical protein